MSGASGGTGEVEVQAAGWTDPGQVAWYVERVGRIEARQAGERMLVDCLPPAPVSVLDLGCGDGRLGALVAEHRASVERVVCIDRSEPMLALARERFAGDDRVEVRSGDLAEPLVDHDHDLDQGRFDVVVSGFAVHHLEDRRKRSLFAEVASLLRPRGRFLNLEVVASGSPARHAEFLAAIGRTVDDPEDRLASVEDQVAWMGQAGLVDPDCLWRWRGFALLVGDAPV